MKIISGNVSCAMINLGIIALVAFALYITNSLWAFLGLLFIFSTKASQIPTKCPKCGCEFTATSKDEDDDED
jgi:hypothetical protein